MDNHYALILAGGSGTRFWPLSRNNKPKQLLDFDGKGSMLTQAITRLSGIIPPERILILTNAVQLDEVRQQASCIPAENIVAEPARRDTAPAVALGIALVARRDPKASMIIVPSDSLILNDTAFQSLADEALNLADREEALITIGIKPTWPCPSYGYIERAAKLEDSSLQFNCNEVHRFCEKPSPEKAQEYLEQGNFTWNAGIFIWNIAHAREQLATHTPELASFINDFTATDDTSSFITEKFPTLTPISIDFALMEKAPRVLNFEANFDWDDVGSWISLAKYLPQDEAKNAANTHLSSIDAGGNIIFSTENRRIALLGVDDLIVVDTGDSILVARKDRADDIKKIVDQLPEEYT